MRSNALRKNSSTQEAKSHESWQHKRARIALVVEKACNLPGNINGPDLEEFAEKYGLNRKSDFV